MKSIFILYINISLLLAGSIPVAAQFYVPPSIKLSDVNSVVTYSLTWNEDSLNPYFKNQEDMILLIGDEMSLFTGKNFFYYRNDGEKYRKEGRSQEFRQIPMSNYRTRFTYDIFKNYPKGKLTYVDKVQPNFLLYEEKLYDFSWEIKDEKMELHGYFCQEARCTYGGRNWIAWFTMDIPYSNGPYKFGGLPGLIVKMYDDKTNYTFELISIMRPYDSLSIAFVERDYVKTNREDLLKAAENFRVDIISRAKAAGLDDSDLQQKIANRMKKRNNPIEF